ncbi:heavy metal translocating P-type ATPase [Dermatophilaceae bacterium Sec6.4]
MSASPSAVRDPGGHRVRHLAARVAPYGFLVVTSAVLGVVLGLLVGGQGIPARWLASGFCLAMAAYIAVGMVRDLLHGNWGVDVLALTAIVSTVAVGEYVAATLVVLMLTGGQALEQYASARAGRELQALLERAPRLAHRLHPVTRALQDVAVELVRPGDLLLVRPAEVIPVDATLASSEAVFDESSLTGESMPVTRITGDAVLSGAINGGSAVDIVATQTAADSQYQRIVALVTDAQGRKAPIARLADRYAIPFTAVSLLIAGTAWAWSGDAGRFAAVLVLATPCPLLIAAPVAFLAGMARASRSGIIIRGGDVVERLSQVRTVAFDKTGTLTQGRPSLVDVRPVAPFTTDEVLRLAASAEQYSSHALASSVVKAAEVAKLPLESAGEAREYATQGVFAALPSGDVIVGKRGHVAEQSGPITAVSLRSGELAVYVCVDAKYAGALVLRDELRVDAAVTLRRLADLGVQETMMLTGDAQATAEQVAADLGIDDVRAECLPEDKVRAVQQHSRGPVMMVGDGVNDAPVLASAGVGVAMGARGSTAASESADVVVMTDDLAKVAEAVAIGRRTMTVARQSIWLGIGLSLVLILIAAFGFIPAIAGALIQELVDLASIGNSLRARGAGRPGDASRVRGS